MSSAISLRWVQATVQAHAHREQGCDIEMEGEEAQEEEEAEEEAEAEEHQPMHRVAGRPENRRAFVLARCAGL